MVYMITKSEYKYRSSDLDSYMCDSSVTLNKSLLRSLPGFKPKEDLLELPNDVKSYSMANSYYPFTEDVDAFARVNHLMEHKESMESFSCSKESWKLKKVFNEYSCLRIQQQYLRSSPLCILILGKPNFGQEDIGRRLSEHLKCVYIDPNVLLQVCIVSKTRMGNFIEFNLRLGRAIDAEVIIRLLSKKVQTAAVLHRGFVLCGFPLVANDLFVEDLISSESAVFNVQEVFEEIVERSIFIGEHLSATSTIVSFDGAEYTAETNTSEFKERRQNTERQTGGLCAVESDGIHSLKKDRLNYKRQLNILFGLFSDPYLIIYIYGVNSDIISKRDNYYWDFISRKQLDLEKLKMFINMGTTSAELVDDLFGGNLNPFLENPNMKHLVKLPENFRSNVQIQLDRYHSLVANSIDARIMNHICQFYIKLDGRLFISEAMHLIKKRIDILGVPNVLLPKRHNFIDDTGEWQKVSSALKQVFFRLSTQNIVAPMFLWDWSEWGVYCPVSMFNGEYRKGSLDWVVQFMNNIFFLADENAFYQFYENPRPFLLPPFPKPGSNILIFGPPIFGKSMVAKCFGYILNSKVLHIHDLIEKYVAQKCFEKKERVQQAAIAEALEMLKQNKVAEFEQEVVNREFKIREWETQVLNDLARLHKLFELSKTTKLSAASSFSSELETTAAQKMAILNEDGIVKNKLSQLNVTNIDTQELCVKLLNDQSFLYTYLPENLRSDLKITPIEFVSNYVNQKVENTQREVEDYVVLDVFSWAFKDLGKFDGWIIDAMTTDLNILKQFCDKWRPHDVLILTKTDTYDLEKLENIQDLEKYFDYRTFFLNIGEVDAAWRCPLIENEGDAEFAIVKEVLDNILIKIVNQSGETVIIHSNLKDKLLKYQYEIKDVESFLVEIGIEPLKVNFNESAVDEVLGDAIYNLRNKYRSGAVPLTQEDRAHELQQTLMHQRDAQQIENNSANLTDWFYTNRRYGDTDFYCPVAFFKNFVFWRGKEEFAAWFEGRVYLMANEENYKTFLKCPRDYLFQVQPNTFPPPRVCVVGLPFYDKTTVSKTLAKNLGVRHVLLSDLSQILESNLNFVEEKKQNVLILDSLNELYDTIFNSLWFKTPMKHSGFVFDGFPESNMDLKYMVEKCAIPDVIICILVSREEYIKRIVKFELKKWQDRRIKNLKQQKVIDLMNKQKRQHQRQYFNEIMSSKGEQRNANFINVTGSESLISEEKETEQHKIDLNLETLCFAERFKDEIEIMGKLDEELSATGVENFEELEILAKQRILLQVENLYEKWIAFFNAIKVTCDAELISWVEVDGSDLDKCEIQVFQAVEPIKFRGVSCFERCYDVSREIAEKLIETGYCFLSFFGRSCPVTFNVGDNLIHTYAGSLSRNEIFPILHRQYIYFIDGKDNRDNFFKNPLKYTNPENYCVPCVPMRIAIIGPSKCGKTVLAKRFQRDLGFKIMTRGQAIRFVLEHPLLNKLSFSVKEQLSKGRELSDEVVMECVQAATFCGESLTHGLLFDGFPRSIKEVNIMSRLGLVPHLIYNLEASENVSLNYATSLQNCLSYSERFIRHLLCEWGKVHEEFCNWCNREYQNLYKILIVSSTWGVWKQALEVTCSVLYERKYYYTFAKQDRPLRLTYMLVTPLEFLERLSEYRNYCPVCYYYFHTLNSSDDIPDRTGLIQFGEKFYWICNQHCEKFLKVPEQFIPPYNVSLPQNLPEIIFGFESNENMFENGFCVVCYRTNFPEKMLNKGNPDLSVKYMNKVFLFDTIHCMKQFMKQHLELSRVTVYFKDSENYTSFEYKDLPVLGMLEQFVARAVIEACCDVNKFRPIIPGLTIATAALIGFGLYLKVCNTSFSNYSAQYREGYDKFNQRKLNLSNYLQIMNRYLNPFLYFEEPKSLILQQIAEMEGKQ